MRILRYPVNNWKWWAGTCLRCGRYEGCELKATVAEQDSSVCERYLEKKADTKSDLLVHERTPSERRTRDRRRGARSYDAALLEAREVIGAFKKQGEAALKDLRPATLVGMYAAFHERVYGVAPAELREPNAMLAASSAAARMLRAFGGDSAMAAELVRWTWARELRRKKSRDADGVPTTFRLSWRIQFSAALETDFRVAMSKVSGTRIR